MEYFIAIEPGDAAKRHLEQTAHEMKRRFGESGCQYESRDDYHITLYYMDGLDCEPQLNGVLQDFSYPAYELCTGAIGTFDNPNKGVLWAGVSGQLDRLFQMRRKLVTALKDAGLPAANEQFIPHITLAYTEVGHLPSQRKLAQVSQRPYLFPVDAIHLYKISYEKQRPRFNKIGSYPLTGGEVRNDEAG